MADYAVRPGNSFRAQQLQESLRKPHLGENADVRQQLIEEISVLTGKLKELERYRDDSGDDALIRTYREMIRDRRSLYRVLSGTHAPPRWAD